MYNYEKLLSLKSHFHSETNFVVSNATNIKGRNDIKLRLVEGV